MTELLRISDVRQFKQTYGRDLVKTVPVSRGKWQSTDAMGDQADTYEASNVVITGPPHMGEGALIEFTGADMPWAYNHFKERVGREPLNPPPSEADWPWHGARGDMFKEGQMYDHTYPERMWPKYAGDGGTIGKEKEELAEDPMRGIRFAYGDLDDVVHQLRSEPFTRQAYLPIWFPEDTGQTKVRVPCSLGYHFIRNGSRLDVNYFIRSCDMTRHLSNDIYFTYMLLEWVTSRLTDEPHYPFPGRMTMFISNLHILRGDAWRYTK